jgi:hypothetical protein
MKLTGLNTCGGGLFMNTGVSLATNASLHNNHQINISREIRKKEDTVHTTTYAKNNYGSSKKPEKRTRYIHQPMQ